MTTVSKCFKWHWTFGIIVLGACASLGSGCDSGNSPEEPLRLLWDFPYEHAGAPKPPPLATDGAVVASAGLDLVKLDAENGEVLWQRRATEEYTLESSSLITDGDQLYAGHIRDLRAYDLQTGEEIWRRGFDDRMISTNEQATFLAKDGLLLASGDYAEIYGIDVATGAIRYRKDFGRGSTYGVVEASGAEPVVYLSRGWSSSGDPGRASNSVDGRITEMDPATGDTTWSFYTQKGGFWDAPLLVEGDVIYGAASGIPGSLYALNRHNGEVIWEQEGRGGAFSIVIGGDRLYGNDGYRAFGRDRATGELLWETNFGGEAWAQVVYLDGHLYHPHGSVLFVLDADTGEIVHEEPSPDGTFIWHVSLGEDQIIAQTTRTIAAYALYQAR